MLKVATVQWMRALQGILAGAAWILLAVSPSLHAGTSQANAITETSPRELFQALNALRVVSNQVYYVRELNLRHDAVRLSFSEGKLAFLATYNNRLTGAVFTGRGRVLALPRDPIEKRQLARFLGEPLLDQVFSSAYLRFTDDTGEELLRQLREAGADAADDPAFAETWNTTVANLNPWHSLRILTDWLAEQPRPYFYAGLIGEPAGPFDVLLDQRWPEQVMVGQPRWVAGERYYDVWLSFGSTREPANPAASFAPVAYSIETTIQPDGSLDGVTTLMLKALRGGERVVPLELSRYLSVQSAEDGEGHPLVFFQNEAVNRHDIALRGDDVLVVALPAARRAGEKFALRITYHGSVINDAGNGIYFVGHRGSWYPHIGGLGNSVPFELTFRFPRRLQLVATGKRLEEREEGDWRISRWRSEVPLPVAGFNLGEYAVEKVESGGIKIELYANRQLEPALLQRFRRPAIFTPLPPPLEARTRPPTAPTIVLPEVVPSPAEALQQMGSEIANAVKFYERWLGPFPYGSLAVSQIPGAFGQGWPGLLYLSTFAFLSPRAQQRAGVSTRAQEEFSELVPYHEVAHQWWGNLVGWDSYRDQWINEGLSNYLAVLYADAKKSSDHGLNYWLQRYRDELAAKDPGRDEPAEEAGPLVLGYRLRSSKSPRGFDHVVYPKGMWVFHMLRMMLREPAANPSKSLPAGLESDARFVQLLRALVEKYRNRSLSTEELQREVEAVMTPAMDLEGSHSMDWFFDEWVRSTDIPRYSVEFTVRPQGKNFLVRGTLQQSGVAENFVAAVPLYAARPGGKPVPLGTVVTSGAATSFQFVSRAPIKRILIDPQLTLLCRIN